MSTSLEFCYGSGLSGSRALALACDPAAPGLSSFSDALARKDRLYALVVGRAMRRKNPWEEELAGRDQSYDADEGDAENQPQQIASAETDDPREARHDRSQNLCACPSKRPAGRRSQVERGSAKAVEVTPPPCPARRCHHPREREADAIYRTI